MDDSDADPTFDGNHISDESSNSEGELPKNRNSGLRTLPVQQIVRQRANDNNNNITCSENESSDNEERKKGTRKRKRNPEGWKRNMSKKLRNSGEPYRSLYTGKLIPAKQMLPPCKDTCRRKCTSKFTEEERQQHFDTFWKLGDLDRQRHFVLHHIQPIQPKYKLVVLNRQKERTLNRAYYLNKDGVRKQVCFLFFRNTLGISERFVRTVKSKDSDGHLDLDLRGKNKKSLVPIEIKTNMRNHLNSIPAVESHYARANSKKKYIEGGKTVTDLYNDYVESCEAKNIRYGKQSMYRHLFNYEYNMSFHIPKKDQCLICTTYHNSDGNEKLEKEQSYLKHIEEKHLSRVAKKNDKEKIDDLFIVACFDLQAALPVPKGDVSSFYYKSRLNSYNFTICELQQQGLGPVDCYFWHEGEGKRGSSEIGTCLLKFLKKKSEVSNSTDLNITFYSDNCGGQGKNKFIVTSYLYALANYRINSITHKFFIVGHGQNEGDASHSVIEKAVKRSLRSGPIYVPAHYSAIIANARKKGSRFIINEMAHSDFYDLKDLTQKTVNSDFNHNLDGQKINFNDIVILKVERSHLDRFFYKTSYKEDEFKSVIIRTTKTRKSIGQLEDYSLKPSYSEPLPISKKKFEDLQSLLHSSAIPAAHHNFFQSLKHE